MHHNWDAESLVQSINGVIKVLVSLMVKMSKESSDLMVLKSLGIG